MPDLIVAVRIEEGTPTVARVGQLEMPVMSFELFRRIATDAITTPDLLKDRRIPALDRRERPVTGGRATLAGVTDVGMPIAGPDDGSTEDAAPALTRRRPRRV